MSATAAPPDDRYHALDSLRGFAMLLGVVLHVGISFMTYPPAFWPVRDREATPLADVFLVAVHDFRMQTFFLLSGFFGCLLYQRYGLAGATKHRLKRVGVPFVLALLLVVPTVAAVGVYAEIENARAEAASPGSVRGEPTPFRGRAADLIAQNPTASTTELVVHAFATGRITLPLAHLWFLYYLLIFSAAVVVLAPPVGRLTGTPLLARVDAAFRRVVRGRWRVPVLAALTFPLMLPMNWVVDTPTTWDPLWHVVGYYFAFFCFGWMLYRHRDLVGPFGCGWKWNLALANVVVLPVMFAVIVTGAAAERAGADATAWKLGGFSAGVVYTWLMITGLWGVFLRLFSRERAWVRYLADSAYWCYLVSLTPIVALQFVVRDWQLPALLKAALVTVAAMALLLASYEWLVRYTFVGAILNGRKQRRRQRAMAAGRDEGSLHRRPHEHRIRL